MTTKRIWRNLVEMIKVQEAIGSIDLALCFLSQQLTPWGYILGLIHGSFIPLIAYTLDDSFIFDPLIPEDYHPRRLNRFEERDAIEQALAAELDLYEEDFLELDNQEEVDRYARQLIELQGQFDESTRQNVREVVLGDKIDISGGQQGAVGSQAHAHDMTFNQTWNQLAPEVDLATLKSELATLRQALRNQVTEPEHDQAVGAVASAEIAAANGDGPTVLQHLANAGKWALGVATAIGTTVAAAAIKAAIGLGG